MVFFSLFADFEFYVIGQIKHGGIAQIKVYIPSRALFQGCKAYRRAKKGLSQKSINTGEEWGFQRQIRCWLKGFLDKDLVQDTTILQFTTL
jgi:hypothetical protein